MKKLLGVLLILIGIAFPVITYLLYQTMIEGEPVGAIIGFGFSGLLGTIFFIAAGYVLTDNEIK